MTGANPSSSATPTSANATAAPALAPDLGLLLKTLGTPVKFQDYLSANRILSMVQFAMLAKSDEAIEEKVLKPYRSAVSGDDIKIGDEGRISEAVWWARHKLQTGEVTLTGTETDKDVLDTTIATTLETQWFAKHGFNFPARRLVEDSLLKKLYLMVSSTPVKFTILLPQEIKLCTSLSRYESAQFNQEVDKPLMIKKQAIDPVGSHKILYERIPFGIWLEEAGLRSCKDFSQGRVRIFYFAAKNPYTTAGFFALLRKKS